MITKTILTAGLRFRNQLVVLLTLTLTAGGLYAAPYGPSGLETEWTQPDGTKLSLRVFGDEFYGRTESSDGYTVVFDPATKTYFYATLSADGNEFASTGRAVGKADPKALGLGKGIEINPASRAAKTKKNYAAHEAVVKQQERWEAVKAAKRNYESFKKEVKKQEEAGKKGFVIPMGTVFPDSEIPSSPSKAQPAGDGTTSGDSSVSPAPPSFTLADDIVGLTILIDFYDDKGTVVTQTQVDDYMNKPNYTGFNNAGSVYDYFFIQSGGKLRYNNNVTYYVRVPKSKAYYNDITTDCGLCGRLILNDALDILIANGYDFSQLSTKSVSGQNRVRACNVFFAGADSGVWSFGLWPHRWVLASPKNVGGGKYISDYQITEIGTTANLTIGTFCHENGHMLLGYPDLYSYDGNAANMGNYSLMAGGNYGGGGLHPTHIDPYLKEASGWMDIIDLSSSSNQRCTVQVDSNQAYRYQNPAKATEYFIFEVRDNTGYEGIYGGHTGSVNPGTGLVAYHVYETGSNPYSSIFTASNPNCSYTKPYELMLVEANQKTTITPWYDDPTPDTSDAFRASGKNQISDTTTPDLKFWVPTTTNGGRLTNSGCNIKNISADSNVMTFEIGSGSLAATPSIALSRSTLNAYANYGVNAASQSFTICNGQNGTLNYTVTSDVPWITFPSANGSVTTNTAAITVNYSNFTTSALGAGTHSGTITVTDLSASPTTKTITVSLTVTAQPYLSVSPASISKTGFAGLAGPQASFQIMNTGGGTMNYTASESVPWLSLSPTSGTVSGETDTITVNFDATSLSVGTYNTNITVNSTDASNPSLTIPVTFTAAPANMVVTSPDGWENWVVGTSRSITWSSILGGNVKIDLLKSNVFHSTVIASTPNTGSYNWSIPSGLTPGLDYKIRITSVESPSFTDQSNLNFVVSPDLPAALDTTGITWSTSGNAVWFAQMVTTHDGIDAAQSGNIGNNGSSSLQATVTGEGNLSFWWKVSSEANYDYLRFYVDDVEQAAAPAISGTVNWVQKTVPISAGSHTIKWTYSKNGSTDGGADTAWVDQVVFTPSNSPDIAVEQPLGTNLTDGVSTIDCGSSFVGTPASALTVTVTNAGTGTLSGLSLSKSGANSGDYTLGSLGATSLSSGASTTFTVTFNSSAPGTRTASIQIASNDADENPFDINLTGTGITPDTTPPTPSPMTFASFPVASGSTSIIMTATTASDSNGVEYFFDETSGNPGGTDSGWQNSPTYQDTGLQSGTAYSYTVTARDKSPNQNMGTTSAVALAYSTSGGATDNFANADIAVSGSVLSSYANTFSSNNIYQQLTEVATTGKPSDRISYLEHKWSFNVTGGTSVTFNIEAYHTTNNIEVDDFIFAYSTNGVNGPYTNMLTVIKTTDNNTLQSYTLPPGISGTVHVRVLDTDPSTGGNGFADSLYIDSMYFTSGTSGGDTNPPTLVSIVDNQGGGPIDFNTPVTYTVTFSKDMNHTTVTADDFANAGTSTIAFGTITEVSPGVFTVLVTPTTTGSLKLRINAGTDLRDANNIPMITTSALADDVTITVTGLNAGVTLSNLNQTYNGSPKPVTVTTNPVGLAHTVTYNLSATVPSNAGTYPVVATITDPNYSGSASGSLVIAKASQTINFAALTPVPNDQPTLALTATATSGLPVSYTSSNTDAATVSGSTVTIVGLGSTTITASQAGSSNYNAASNVLQTLTVVRANPLAVTSGPYKVLIGQTLALSGSGSFSSYGETLTTYEWDLNNDNTFGDVTGATPSAIGFQTLIDTWGMTQGLNTIQLKVTDSANKTSTVSTTVELVLALTWDANGTATGQTNGAGAWLDVNKWWDGTANANWVAGSDAVFGGVATNGGAVTLASPTTANSIIFNQHTGTYTLGTSGQAITLNAGITLNPTANTVSIISPVTLSGNQIWTNNGASLSTSRNTDLVDNNGFQLTVDGTGTTNFGIINNAEVALAGSGDLVKNGIGRLNLGGVNSGFTGKVTINGGVMQVNNNAGALGNGNVTINNGVLSFYWGVTYNRTLGIGVDQVQVLGGESGVAGAGTSGPTINLGSTVIWGASGEGAATGYFNPDKFVLGDSGTTNAGATTFANGIDLNGVTRTIVVPKGLSSGGNVSKISGEISSLITAGLIKEGDGTLILDTDNTYLGDTTISGGTLRIGNGTPGSLNGGDYSGHISIANNATLEIWSTTAQILSGEITGAGGLNKAYGGELTLSGPNTYTGRTSFLPQTTTGFTANISSFNSVNGGTPIMASSSLGAPTTIANGTIDVGSSGKRASVNLIYTGPGETTDRVINLGYNDTASQTLTASGSGLLKFTSAMTSSSITTQSGKLILAGTGSGEITEALPALPSGGLTKSGSGTWTLGGASSYSGPTAITAGKLFINGSLSNVDIALSVASGATLCGTGIVGRNVNIASGGKLEFDISTIPANHDHLEIGTGRSFDFTGASELTITSTAGAGIGTYTLVTGGNNITGVVPITVNLPVGWTATVSISGNSLLLNVTSIAGGVAGSLVVAEPENLISSGSVGGPFSPDTIQYTLSNPGDFPIEWTVGNAAAWVDLSATFGTLAAGANTIVTISLNSNTYELGEGSYNDTITFTNTSNSNGNTTRAVSLSVNPLSTYTISYSGNGNTGGAAPTDQTKTENIDLNLSGPGTLERTGYSFTEWNAALNGTGTSYGAGVSYTANAPLALYAQWGANSYTVTFDPNGGDAPSPMSKVVTFDATYDTLATTTRTGYTFNGWFTAADGGVEVTAATPVTTAGDHTLYAQWTVNTYTVTYVSNTADSGTAPASQTKNVGEDITLATNTGNLVKAGYTLTGWNIDPAGSGTHYDLGALYTIAVDTTLHAEWTLNTAGFSLSKTTATVAENGGTDSFTVVLDSQPVSVVVIDISSSDTNEATVSPVTLTFTSSDWDTAQTVTITGINDDTAGDNTATITASVNDASSDNAYDALADQAVDVTCTNDDTAGFTVTAISGNTDESGTTATFTVALTSQPTDDVTIGLSSSDTGEGTVNPTSLSFTNSNWNTPQTVTVTGVDDALADGPQAYTIVTAAATSLDTVYNGIDPDDVNVTNNDNEVTLANWIGNYDVGSLTAPGDDYDGDGLSNALENYFGTDPSIANSGLKAEAVTTGANTIFTFNHPINANPAADISASYLWSKNMTGFNNDGVTDADATTVNFSTGTSAAGMLPVSATVSGTPTNRLFVRIEVIQTTP